MNRVALASAALLLLGGACEEVKVPPLEPVGPAASATFVEDEAFHEATREHTRLTSGGFVVADLDGEGRLDLVVANGWGWHLTWASESSAPGKPVLLLQDDDGAWTREPLPDGIPDGWYTTVAAADFDGDDRVDLYLANGDTQDNLQPPESPLSPDPVVMNGEGGLALADLSGDVVPGTTFGACVADFDRDGDNDMFLASQRDPDYWENDENGYFIGDPDRLYRNDDGVLVDVTDASGLGEDLHWSNACLAWDYDGDGLEDIWIARDKALLKLYRNLGGLQFEDVSERVLGEVARRPGNWMGFALADYDGDGDQDVFVTNWGISAYSVVSPTSIGLDDAYVLNALLVNNGDETFTDVAQEIVTRPRKVFNERWDPPPYAVGLAAWEFGWAATAGDYDNDGDVDLYWNGNLAIAYYTAVIGREENGANPGRLMQNEGGGVFSEVGESAGIQNVENDGYIRNGWGSELVDLDRDGALDLLVGTQYFGDDDYPGDVRLFHNQGTDGHWLEVELDATASAPHAIGAHLIVETGEREHHRVVASSSAVSTAGVATPVHFGLGSADAIARLTVLWPSGTEQVLEDVSVDQILRVVEP